VRIARRSTGGVPMIDRSRTPERQLQRARDRRGGQRQHVHVRAQLLQPFLVADAEALFLVDDQQAEVLEPDALGQQRVGADDDIDLPSAMPSRSWRPALAETKRDSWRTSRESPGTGRRSSCSAGARAAWWARSPRPARP
jgi:hypothetical protein